MEQGAAIDHLHRAMRDLNVRASLGLGIDACLAVLRAPWDQCTGSITGRGLFNVIDTQILAHLKRSQCMNVIPIFLRP